MKYVLDFYLLGVVFTMLSIFVRLIESLGGGLIYGRVYCLEGPGLLESTSQNIYAPKHLPGYPTKAAQ
ncbi:hypothetical protein ACRRTK_013597 [Alexandromys fortis]